MSTPRPAKGRKRTAVVPCIVCGAFAQWMTIVPDDENAEHPIHACDDHLATMLQRQYEGDVLVCLLTEEADAVLREPRP